MHCFLWLLIFFLPLASTETHTPFECNFDDPRTQFAYALFTGIKGTGCLGWAAGPNCPIQETDMEDLQKVVAQQVARDGQFENSSYGRWTAGFRLGTTAFDDRYTGYFDRALAYAPKDVVPMTWYYSRNGNFLYVKMHQLCEWGPD